MKLKLTISMLLLALLTGCTNNNIYYWGNYEQTLYSYTKEPNSSSFERHKRELVRILDKGRNGEKPVPPGIYFELGIMEARSNNLERAISLLRQEKQAFPESTKFVDNAIKMLEETTG